MHFSNQPATKETEITYKGAIEWHRFVRWRNIIWIMWRHFDSAQRKIVTMNTSLLQTWTHKHKSLPLNPILNRFSPVHFLTVSFPKNNFNFIVPYLQYITRSFHPKRVYFYSICYPVCYRLCALRSTLPPLADVIWTESNIAQNQQVWGQPSPGEIRKSRWDEERAGWRLRESKSRKYGQERHMQGEGV